ncbi:SRPBCC domain-containing protein [Conexibacter sp. DBS9H8]|uniref:SRPBCC domain-containing protein n=1 Tax=Conexibacter sp. DBS9H8 TaxID=2937801 RepID=UPI0035307C62
MTVTSSCSATVTLPAADQILIEREFAAPASLVWRAMTEPELVRRWWHANRGEITACEIEHHDPDRTGRRHAPAHARATHDRARPRHAHRCGGVGERLEGLGLDDLLEVMPRCACPSCRWIATSGTTSWAISIACACRS